MIDRFLEIEEEYDFWKRNLNNFPYWPYIRRTIYESLSLIRSSNPDKKSINTNRKFQILFSAIRNLRDNKFLSQNIDILIRNHPRKIKDSNDQEICIYTDELIKNLKKKNVLIMEKSYQGGHSSIKSSTDVFYMDLIDIITYSLYPLLQILSKKHLIKIEEEMKEIIDILQNELKVKINREHIISETKKLYIHYKIKYYLLNKILDKINPRLIIEVVHYNFENMIINEIAKKKNIKAIELQHGILGEKHINYNYAKKGIYGFFPDEICLFSEYWKENTKLPIDESKQHVIGFPYLEKYCREGQECGKKNCILFISQATIGCELSQLATQLSEKINSLNLDYNIIYKLHPAEYLRWKSDYPWLYEMNNYINVIDYNVNIYSLFERSSVQIGVYSTALYEGLAFNLATCIFNMSEAEYIRDLYINGYADLVNNVEEIIEFLGKIESNKVNNAQYFWSQNALEKLIELCE